MAVVVALAGVVFVDYGAAVTHGTDLTRSFGRFIGPVGGDCRAVLRADGRVLTSDRFERPGIRRVLAQQPPLPFA